LGNQELRLTKASGTVAATRYYEHNDQVVAMRTTAGVQLLATDHNDTAEEAVDATTLGITQRRLTPFGQARGTAAPSWPGDKGFVDGTKDTTTGLTQLGARDYDPATGRFISVDPVFDLSDPQSWNGYAYADNSPVTHSDPDGQMIVDPGGGGSHSTYNPDNDDRNTARRLGAISRYGINYGPLQVQKRLLAHDRALYDIQHQNPIIAKKELQSTRIYMRLALQTEESCQIHRQG
jgi:RHS repeat-associated protein